MLRLPLLGASRMSKKRLGQPEIPRLHALLRSPGQIRNILPMEREHNLTACDAAYLELAICRGAPLATLDKPLEVAAKISGVAPFSPEMT